MNFSIFAKPLNSIMIFFFRYFLCIEMTEPDHVSFLGCLMWSKYKYYLFVGLMQPNLSCT